MTTVRTTSGILTVERVDGLLHARGVPYATARRFEAPQAINSPDIFRDATKRGPKSPQHPSRLDGVNGPIGSELTASEDALVVTVVAPDNAVAAPVMVWIHGGAYMSGAGEAQKYDADSLASEGVMVVNVTYRLGVFGYLPPTWAGTDNLGLLDQLEALRWVHENAAAFGGNADNVTVFGQSAGGHSIASLLRSWPTPHGLMRRAIVQSAPLGLADDRAQIAETLRSVIDEHVTPDATDEEVLHAQDLAAAAAAQFGLAGALPFAPIPGVTPLTADSNAALTTAAGEVELLIGHTVDDAVPFLAMPSSGGSPAGLIKAAAEVNRPAARAVTERAFGGAELIDPWERSGGTYATYQMQWAPAGAPFGACHCIELPLLFDGDWSDAPMLASNDIPASFATHIRRLWAAFASNGVSGLPDTHLLLKPSAVAPTE